LTPKADTPEVLREWLTRSLIAVAYGNWDDLERSELPTGKKAAVLKIQTIIYGVTVALVPIGTLFLIQLKFPLPGEVRSYGEVAAVLWTIINVLHVIDPRLNEKLEALGKVGALIPGSPKR
jgi:hypothetical protein